MPLESTTIVPALEDAVLRSTPALAVDVADDDTEPAGAVAEAAGAPPVTAGLLAAGVVPPPPHPVRAADRARIARPAPNTRCFMVAPLVVPGADRRTLTSTTPQGEEWFRLNQIPAACVVSAGKRGT